MLFWETVAKSSPCDVLELKCLFDTASMFLSVPSAEVADERTFSSTGGT